MTLEEAIHGHLENWIDEYLALQEIPIRQRPTRAAMTFVKEVITDMEGDTKDDYFEKPWFAIIHHHVTNWYKDNYGEAFAKDDSAKATGVVLIRGSAFEVSVPLVRHRVEVEGETMWVLFPSEVDADEKPLDWLKSPPDLNRLDTLNHKKLLKDVTFVGNGLRTLRIKLMTVKASDPRISSLLDGVLAAFESAAASILRSDDSARGDALWSLQMALEKVLNAFALQKKGNSKQGHNLYILFDDISAFCDARKRHLLKKMPPHDLGISDGIIQYRYGLPDKPNIIYVVEAYKAALQLACSVSEYFDREYNLGKNFGLLLKKPPYLSLPVISATNSSSES